MEAQRPPRNRFVLALVGPFRVGPRKEEKPELKSSGGCQHLTMTAGIWSRARRDPISGCASGLVGNEENKSTQDICNFTAYCPSSSPSVIIPDPRCSMPPLARYRSQENVIVSPLHPKSFPRTGTMPARKLNAGPTTSHVTRHPDTEQHCSHNINAISIGASNSNWNEQLKRHSHGSWMGNASDDEYLATSNSENRRGDLYQRRRASIVTIHMNALPCADSNSKMVNAPIELCNRKTTNLFTNPPTTSNECATSNSVFPPNHSRNVISSSSGRYSEKLEKTFRSSIDLPSRVHNHRHNHHQHDQPHCTQMRASGDPQVTHRGSRRLKTPLLLPLDANSSVPQRSNIATPEDRNIFKMFVIKMRSISSPSDDESSSASQVKSGSETETMKKSSASITLVYKDFDDMIARMLDAKELVNHGEQTSSVERPLPDAQMYFTGQLSPRIDFPPSTPNLPHSDESRRRACNHLSRVILKHRIDRFNRKYPQFGLSLLPNSETYEGSLQVFMNLLRPVEMNEPNSEGLVHLPRDTVKVHRITSETTTRDLIKKFLQEFNINENPRKFVLYHRHKKNSKVRLRRLDPEEFPLRIYLEWAEKDKDWTLAHSFILQENDTGEVEWDLFSLPELKSFLRMLNKEERKFIEEIEFVYKTLEDLIKNRIKELEEEEQQEQKDEGEEEGDEEGEDEEEEEEEDEEVEEEGEGEGHPSS